MDQKTKKALRKQEKARDAAAVEMAKLARTLNEVKDDLNRWVYRSKGGGSLPMAAFHVADTCVAQLRLGGVVVWSNDENTRQELTKSSCLDRYYTRLRDRLIPFLGKHLSLPEKRPKKH